MDIEELKKDLSEDKQKAIDEIIGERDKLKEDNEKLGEDIEKKDQIIEQKNKDIIGARKEYKRLKDMTEEEREALSEKEIEILERQEQLEQREEEERKKQEDRDRRDRENRIEKAVKQHAGDDEEYAKKIREGMEEFKNFDEAWTEDEIGSIADRAVNLIPADERPENAVQHVGGAEGGGDPVINNKTEYAETPQGKNLAQALNLPSTQQQQDQQGGGNNDN